MCVTSKRWMILVMETETQCIKKYVSNKVHFVEESS